MLVLDDLEDKAEEVLAGEGVLEGAHLVKNAAEGPNVGCVVVGLGLTDFRRHIVRGALHSERIIISILKNFRNTEVTKFYRIIARHEYIL